MHYGRHLYRLAVLAIGLALLVVPAAAERRVALVIGNSAYEHTTPLANPSNDATDIGAALKRLGFEVIGGSVDLDKRSLERKIREFTTTLAGADVALFFYAGHAVQVGDQNYLVPIDARLATEADVDFETISLRLVLQHMERDREWKTSLIFLDACRDNPLARNLARGMGTRSSSVGQGLAAVKGGVGTLIGFSTQPGNVARDGTGGRNSPYAGALLKQMEGTKGDINAVLINVRNQVLQATSGLQVPWEHSSLTQQFHFQRVALAPSTADQPLPAQSGPTAHDEAMAWSTTKDTTSIAVLEAFLRRYSSGVYAEMARARLQELKDKQARDQSALAQPPAPPPAAVPPAKTPAIAPPARTTPSTKPEALGRSEVIARIAAWIEQDYLNDNIAYAETVDWYDQGTIGRDAVVKDRAKYLARWPDRKYTLVPGSIQITPGGPNRYAATFEHTYVVRSAARNAQSSGKSRIMVDVEMIGGIPHVARQKEIVGRQ